MDEEIASIRIVPEAFEKNKEIEALSIFEVVCKVNAMISKTNKSKHEGFIPW